MRAAGRRARRRRAGLALARGVAQRHLGVEPRERRVLWVPVGTRRPGGELADAVGVGQNGLAQQQVDLGRHRPGLQRAQPFGELGASSTPSRALTTGRQPAGEQPLGGEAAIEAVAQRAAAPRTRTRGRWGRTRAGQGRRRRGSCAACAARGGGAEARVRGIADDLYSERLLTPRSRRRRARRRRRRRRSAPSGRWTARAPARSPAARRPAARADRPR